MGQPSQAEIDAIKASYPLRSVHLVELVSNSDDPVVFVMTGPSSAEYERFVEEVQAATTVKDEYQRSRNLRTVVQNAALAQIRWPSKDDARATFEMYPAMSVALAEQLHNSAGASYEVRAKKL